MRYPTRAAIAALAAGGAGLLLPLSTAAAKSRACNVKALHYSYRQNGSTQSVAVETLTTTASCSTAQKLAATVAKDLLHDKKVPAKIDGLAVKLTKPCGACAPLDRVRATGRGQTVTFTVMGGAG